VGNKQKAVAGDAKWSDYMLEGRVLVKIPWKWRGQKDSVYTEQGDPSAGLLFRVNEPGDQHQQVYAYSVTHDSKKVMLNKCDGKAWKQLASYDITKLKTKSRLNEWSMIRVEAIGPKIRVWFNRTHGDPEKGLRIEYTDKDNPILTGAIGCSAYKTIALFDDIIVLPVEK